MREDLSDDHSILQSALCIFGTAAAFCDTSDADNTSFQVKYYLSNTPDRHFISAILYSLKHRRCQKPEVDPKAKQMTMYQQWVPQDSQ